MVHKYFEISQDSIGNLDVTFSDDSISSGEVLKLNTLSLNKDEAKYLCESLASWLGNQGV